VSDIDLQKLLDDVRYVKDRWEILDCSGRYLDRLERRDGQWKIALRRCRVEWTLQGDGSVLSPGNFAGFVKGSWDTDDPSYLRPMTLDDQPIQRW
jgi:hypothetical protein